MKRNPSIY